jgi:3-oxoacyl-[acyl-carrier-protein] synthase II
MTRMRPRVVVTGIGIVSPLGSTAESFWGALLAGASGARRVAIDGVPDLTAFPVDGVEDAARARFGQREARRMDRAGRMAALAAVAALDDAGAHRVAPERTGAVIGCVHGGAQIMHEGASTLAARGPERVSPLTIPLGLTNAPVAAVARMLGVHGPTGVTGTACAAGTDAIGAGLALIRDGRAELVLAGGAEAPLAPLVVAGYRQLGALSTTNRAAGEASRPFDVDRDGFVIGEGAGVLVLEEREHALARASRIYAEVIGYAGTCDAAHLTDPDPAGTGAARAIALALADGGVAAPEVGYVNAHATSTPAGDRAEARALAAAGLDTTPVSATKAAHGHALGAAGGIEAVVTALALAHQVLPATLNLDRPDPDPPLAHVRASRPAAFDVAISNSFGFGGHNACLVMRTHRAAGERH